MGSYFRRVRFAIVFIVILVIGRVVLGATGVPYATGTNIFSIVTFSFFASILFGGFSRAVWGFRLGQAMMLGVAIGLSGQILIFLATLLSYVAGVETYFNNPAPLGGGESVPLSQAMLGRTLGLVANTIFCAIAALIGWALGKLIPERA